MGYLTSAVPRFTIAGKRPACVPAPLPANFVHTRNLNTKGSSANDEHPTRCRQTETVFPFRALPSIPWTKSASLVEVISVSLGGE